MSAVGHGELLDSLSACPFCGNLPVIRTTMEKYAAEGEYPDGEYDAGSHICCDTCGYQLDDEYLSDAIARWNTRADDKAKLLDEVERLRAERDAVEPKVKALEWREYRLTTHEYGIGSWEANGIGCVYEILDVGDDGKNGLRYYLRGFSQYEFLDDAKVAAQEREESRVLSALQPSGAGK